MKILELNVNPFKGRDTKNGICHGAITNDLTGVSVPSATIATDRSILICGLVKLYPVKWSVLKKLLEDTETKETITVFAYYTETGSDTYTVAPMTLYYPYMYRFDTVYVTRFYGDTE